MHAPGTHTDSGVKGSVQDLAVAIWGLGCQYAACFTKVICLGNAEFRCCCTYLASSLLLLYTRPLASALIKFLKISSLCSDATLRRTFLVCGSPARGSVCMPGIAEGGWVRVIYRQVEVPVPRVVEKVIRVPCDDNTNVQDKWLWRDRPVFVDCPVYDDEVIRSPHFFQTTTQRKPPPAPRDGFKWVLYTPDAYDAAYEAYEAACSDANVGRAPRLGLPHYPPHPDVLPDPSPPPGARRGPRHPGAYRPGPIPPNAAPGGYPPPVPGGAFPGPYTPSAGAPYGTAALQAPHRAASPFHRLPDAPPPLFADGPWSAPGFANPAGPNWGGPPFYS